MEIFIILVNVDEKVVDWFLELVGKFWFVICVSMGNFYCIIFIEDVNVIDLVKIGLKFEYDLVFLECINIEFI